MTDVTGEQGLAGLSAADEQVLRELTERARTGGLKLTGEGGLLGKLTKMVIEGALEGELDDHLGQLPEQPALTGQLQPAGPGPLGELAHQLLVSRRQLELGLILVRRHVSHLVSPPFLELHR